ncbi:MAG TPA: hypothetical protein VKB69_05455, partial [Micromonosporaceae bacterium]|nr:hypothetical protein [Micromonosporaceae bacterium]
GMVLDPVSGASVDAPLGPDPRLPVQPDFIRVTSSVGGSPELKVLLLVPAGHPVPVTVSAASAFPAQVAGPVAVTWAGPAAVVRPGPPATNWPTRTFPVLEQAPGRTLVEVVGADGTVRPLQWLDGIAPSSCTALVTYLICPTSSTTATVWQFPDRP